MASPQVPGTRSERQSRQSKHKSIAIPKVNTSHSGRNGDLDMTCTSGSSGKNLGEMSGKWKLEFAG